MENMTVADICVGDLIRDFAAQGHFGESLTAKVIGVDIKLEAILCDNREFPQQYPYTFYDFERYTSWKKK